jgi:putative tryptophan/tyrosine transport system substrate-binding protein
LLYLFEDCALDTDRRELRRGDRLIPIEPQVFDLLEHLISNREHVVSKDDLIASIWGGRIVSESALGTRINAARSAIGDNGEAQRLIKTLPRKGVRFVGVVREERRSAEAIAVTSAEPATDPPQRLATPMVARAQQPAMPVIGFLGAGTAADSLYRASAFRDGLMEAGLIDGHNVAVEFRWAENKPDRAPALAADLAHRQVAVIVAQQINMHVARAATSTIPIVFVIGTDPIAAGLVPSLSRPGGNMTGVSFTAVHLQPKRLELLHELVPPPATIAWLGDPRSPSFEIEVRDIEAAARELGRSILSLNATSPNEIDAAFSTIVQSRAGALLIGSSNFLNVRRRQLAALATRHGLPAISNIREFVMAGGLMSYGASDSDAYRRAGSHYVPRILKGAKPCDLPVEMPIKYELVINVVAARVLGLEIRPTLLARADEVIE